MQRVGADAASEERASSGRMGDHIVGVVREVGYGETMGRVGEAKRYLGLIIASVTRAGCIAWITFRVRGVNAPCEGKIVRAPGRPGTHGALALNGIETG